MAAAADRLAGDVFDRVSPELVLVDAALAEEVRRRMGAPDDTLARVERMDIEPRLRAQVDEVERDEETGGEANAVAGGDPHSLPAFAIEVGHRDLGIDDLIVIPEDDLRNVPPALVVVPSKEVTQRVVEPETFAELVPEVDDVIVVPAAGRTQPRSTHQSYPTLPSPSDDADEEDATDAVLRLIRDHIGREAPTKRRRLLLRLARRG